MNDSLKLDIVDAVKLLYGRNPTAKKLFDWCASLQKDAAETTMETFVRKLEISNKLAVGLAKELQQAGCGQFIPGRRGANSRFAWEYSRVSLGKVASGERVDVQAVSADLATEAEEVGVDDIRAPLTIARAKTLLAQSLSVLPEQIEIVVRA